MTDLQQRLSAALQDAGARGVDSYVFGEALVRRGTRPKTLTASVAPL